MTALLPVPAGCLHECLKEAHLESYYSNFIRHGIVKCEGLANLSMHEYSRFGVLSMEDRVRLFKLVQIVRSVLADGLHCQHEYPPTGQCKNVPLQAPAVSDVIRQQVKKNATHDITKKKTQRPRADVQYLPGSDSPIFKCRKALTFSDSEEEKDGEEFFVGNVLSEQREATTSRLRGDSRDQHSTNQVEQKKNDQLRLASRKHKPPEVFYVDLKAPVPRARETDHVAQPDVDDYSRRDSGNNSASTPNRTNSSFVTKRCHSLELSASKRANSFEMNRSNTSMYSTESLSKKPPSSESGLHSRSISSRSRSASPPKNRASQRSFDGSYESNSDLNPGAGGEVHLAPRHLQGSGQDVESKAKSSQQPASALFVDAFGLKDGTESAYFPQFQPPPKSEPRVETIVHTSAYNYGVPGLHASPKASSSKATMSPGRKGKKESFARNREERIRVCVRKRPPLKKELKRQEADVVTVQDEDTIVVEESKVTIDLSKYIQQVRIRDHHLEVCFLATLTNGTPSDFFLGLCSVLVEQERSQKIVQLRTWFFR